MGNAVLGGPEITGVLVLLVLFPAQATNAIRVAATNKRRSSDLFVEVILCCGTFVLFLGERFAGDAILTLNPLAQIDKLTPLGTEGTKRIIFPLDWLTAGWTLHESCSHAPARVITSETQVA